MSIQIVSAPPAPAASRAQAPGVPFHLRPPIVLAVGLGLACLPLLLSHAQLLWEKPHYQFFPWALLGAAVLAWRRREELRPLTPGLPAVAFSLLGLGWVLLAVAGYLVSPWLGMNAALVILTGFLWLFGGRRLFVVLIPSLLLLLVLVPPPLGLDTRVIFLLQSSTTRLASQTLDWLQLSHVPLAHTLQVPGDLLLVDEACSGIASLFSVVTFALFFCFFLRRNVVHMVLLILFAVLFVVLGNVARVVAITVLKSRYGVDLVNGWKHEMTGLVVFAVCLALSASMDQAILFFTDAVRFFPWRKRTGKTAAVPPPAKAAAIPMEEKTPAALSLRGAGYLGAAFAIVGLLTMYNVWIHPHAFRGDPSTGALNIANVQQKMNADFLPKEVGQWQQENYERKTRSSGDPIGHYSDVWRYRHGKFQALVSVDYPFRGGHDLTVCYTAQGWHESTTAFPALASDTAGPTTATVVFERSAIEKGYLWFSALDEGGFWLPADALHRDNRMNRLVDRFATEASTTVQVQVFLATAAALDKESSAEVQQLFEEVRARIHDGLFSTGKEQP